MASKRSASCPWTAFAITILVLLIGVEEASARLNAVSRAVKGGNRGLLNAKGGKKDSARLQKTDIKGCEKAKGKRSGKKGCPDPTSAPDVVLAPPAESPSLVPTASPSFKGCEKTKGKGSGKKGCPSPNSAPEETLNPPAESPTLDPSSAPTPSPTLQPSSSPTHPPTELPTPPPSLPPSPSPTLRPSLSPTSTPTDVPIPPPTSPPSPLPTPNPTSSPTPPPTLSSQMPTRSPTQPPVPSPSQPPTGTPDSLTPISPPPSPPHSPTPPSTPSPTLSQTPFPSPSPTTPPPTPLSSDPSSQPPTSPPSPSPTTSPPTPTPPTPSPSPSPTLSSTQPVVPSSPQPTPSPTVPPSPPPTISSTPPTDPASPKPSPLPSPFPNPPSGSPPTIAPTSDQSESETQPSVPTASTSPSVHPTLSQLPSTAPSFSPSAMPTVQSPSPQPSQLPSGSPSLSLAPTVAVFVTEQVGDTKVSTCIRDPADSVTTSSKSLEFQYIMLLTSGANATSSMNDVQDGLHSQLASMFLECDFARRLGESRRLQDPTNGINFVSISSNPSDSVPSSPLPPESCPASASVEGTDCFLVDGGFTVAYLGEPLSDSELTDTFEPFLREQMEGGGTLEASNPDIVALEFLRFTNVDPVADSGSPSGIKETNISNQGGDNGMSMVAPAVIAGAAVGLVLVGLVAIRKRESIYHYFRHEGEEESIDETNDQEISLAPPVETAARDLIVDTQENTSDESTIQWSFAVSENAKCEGENDEFEVEYRRRPEVPIAEAMLLTGEELDDIIKGLSSAPLDTSSNTRHYESSDTVVL